MPEASLQALAGLVAKSRISPSRFLLYEKLDESSARSRRRVMPALFRRAALGCTLLAALLGAGSPAFATDAGGAMDRSGAEALQVEIAPPDLPPVELTSEHRAVVILPPDLPGVAGVDAPPAIATGTAGEAVAQAIRALLEEPGPLWKKTAKLSRNELAGLTAAYAAQAFAPV
jgi:hypothetical protein